MKVEYLEDGSPECPLVRLFEFTPTEAQSLQIALRGLVNGDDHCVSLSQFGASSVDGFHLSLNTGSTDLGLVREEEDYKWVLRPEGWENVEGLIDPFTKGATGFQWLSKIGNVSLLLSQAGQW